MHPWIPNRRAGHSHVGAPWAHSHLGHHVRDVLTLRCHSIFRRWRSIAHSVLHCWVSGTHHVPLHGHPGHHPIPVALHHARVTRGPRHSSHRPIRAIGTHRSSHHHPVRTHHFHASAIWHHVRHGFACSHHALLLHAHSHHCHLLRIHLSHSRMHLLLIHHLHISSHPWLVSSHIPHHVRISSHLGHSLVSHHGMAVHALSRPGPRTHVIGHAVRIPKSKALLHSSS